VNLIVFNQNAQRVFYAFFHLLDNRDLNLTAVRQVTPTFA